MSFVIIGNKLDHIKHGIYISNWNSAIDEKLLKDHNIKAVLCINNVAKQKHELKIYDKLGIHHYQIDADDLEHVDLKRWFEKTNSIIEWYVARDMPIVVHCTAGISRSVTVVLAYLIYLTHCRGTKRPGKPIIHRLYKWLRTKRDQALPNPGFYNQLIKFELECLEESKKDN
jgi:protein tyrosine phosphatase